MTSVDVVAVKVVERVRVSVRRSRREVMVEIR